MPCCRIESINSCNASRPKSFRGCKALGVMAAKSIWCTLSPDSDPSVRGATEGVPISAPRPLPRPDRAMRLRLPEQVHQRKQQSMATRPAIHTTFCRAKLYEMGKARRALKKNSEKPTREIQCQCDWPFRMALKQTRNFYPVGLFVCLKPHPSKPTQTRPGKKEQIPCIQSFNLKR
jgi:hypothetical protein